MTTYSTEQVAKMANVDPETVRRWIRTNKLPAKKFPEGVAKGKWYVQEEDIPSYLRKP